MGTFIVGSILLFLVGIVVRKMIRDKKNGKSHCGCDCNQCGGHCHSK